MNLEVFRALSWLSAPCVCHSLMGVSQSEWPARLVFSARNVSGASRHCLKHWKACRSLFGASLTVLPLSRDLDAKEKKKNSRAATEAQRTWQPSLTDVFRLCCCSLSVQRHRAREVIHDASLLVTVSRLRDGSRLRINTSPALFW